MRGPRWAASRSGFCGSGRKPRFTPSSRIPRSRESLCTLAESHPRLHVLPYALSDESSTAAFHVTRRKTSSSLLVPTEKNLSYHPTDLLVEEKIEVETRRLDDLDVPGEVDLLKLDLQGGELRALRGAPRTLRSTGVVTVEVEFVELYEHQPLFADIDLELRGHGFELFNLYELYTQPDGQLTAGDAIYINKAR